VLVQHFLEYYARNTPDLPCLTQHGKTTSFGEVNALANRVANGLLTLGVEKGQRVAILGENSLQHLLLFMGAGKIGAVTVSLNSGGTGFYYPGFGNSRAAGPGGHAGQHGGTG
jgi:acyl-CoA synthetase (AMP-forming)/AMP-acid ligase II